VETLVVAEENVFSPGAQSLIFAAMDELRRRYGEGADSGHLTSDEMAPPLGAFVVARLDTHLAGGVGLRPIGAEPGVYGEIKRLWVRPDLRRSGVASALMAEVELAARKRNYQRLFLETGDLQPEAVAFYRRLAWEHIDEFPPDTFHYDGGIKFTREL